MKEYVVEINGKYLVKRRAGSPRIASQEAIKYHPEFGIRGNRYGGGPDRQLQKGEALTITVRNRADCPHVKFTDEER